MTAVVPVVKQRPARVLPAPPSDLGRLVVNLTPGFASLRFLRGSVEMPAARENGVYRLAVGEYRVLVTAPGFSGVEAHLVIRKGQTAQLDVGLTPLPRPTGSLVVGSGGTLAEILLDGRRIGVTPAVLHDIPVGLHSLELRTRSAAFRRSVAISQGRPTVVEVELSKAR